ncbi:uncharacterized protein LOC136037603 [Artemia franciscana]|uniref:uncharacterized protein LOC136037603 n=1 Tax=Artemia franciscana TaxID=6661 RepID=UPI0032DA90BD
MESKEKVKDRPVLQSMPTIQVTSPLSEYDCEPDLWDVDSDSEKEVCPDLSNISNDEYAKTKTNFSGYQAPVERTISQQGEIFSEMGTAKKSRSWHCNLKDSDPEVKNENASVPISDTISDSNCTSPKHSVVISESATPLSGADDEMSDEESVKAQNRRKSSVLLVPEKKSRHSRRHERGNCCNSFLFCKLFL